MWPASTAGNLGSVRLTPTEIERLDRLNRILARARTAGVRGLATEELTELSDLYRHACSQLARLETRGESRQSLAQLRRVTSAAHGVLFRGLNRPGGGLARRALRMLAEESPRAIRAEWKLLLASFALLYGLASSPVRNVQATSSPPTFDRSICSSAEYRPPPASPP